MVRESKNKGLTKENAFLYTFSRTTGVSHSTRKAAASKKARAIHPGEIAKGTVAIHYVIFRDGKRITSQEEQT